MQESDSRPRNPNPAKSRTNSGKLWENGAYVGDCPPKYRFGEFEVDPASRRVLLRGKPVALRNRPFEVLLYLVRHRGRLVEQSELLAALWGASDVYHDALRKAVGSIRSALSDDSHQPRFIETHWGKGYRFIGEVIEDGSESGNTSLTDSFAAPLASSPLIPTGSERLATVSVREAWPRFMMIAAAVIVLGTAFALRNPHPAIRPTAPAVPAASSKPIPEPVSESQRTAYLEAQYLLSQRSSESIAQASAIFAQITQADPGAGDAYAGLAECYALGYWGFWEIDKDLAVRKSAEYAQMAVHADPGSGYAHAQLAAALSRQLRISDAQAEFERALAIRPNDAEVHHAYGVFLDDTHRADRGIEEMKRAIELEPLSLAYKTDLGMSYYFALRYSDAIAQYKSVLKLSPGYIEAREYLASMYVYEAEWPKAKTEYAAIDRLRGAHTGDFGESSLRLITEFKTGEERKARAGVRALLASPSVLHSYALAKIYAQLGRTEDALRYLHQVVSSNSPEMFLIPDDPLLAPLRGNPEFETLARRASAMSTSSKGNGPVHMAEVVIPAKLTAQ